VLEVYTTFFERGRGYKREHNGVGKAFSGSEPVELLRLENKSSLSIFCDLFGKLEITGQQKKFPAFDRQQNTVNEDEYVYVLRYNTKQINIRKPATKETKSIPRACGIYMEYNFKSSIFRIRMRYERVQMTKARKMEQWVKDIRAINADLMTPSYLSEEVKLKESV
jgi:hypothetical protein